MIAHLSFVAFLLLGGFLALRWPRLAWVHLSAVALTVALFLGGADCPLTSVEKHLRRAAGDRVYDGSFVNHYIVRHLHPFASATTIRIAEPFVVIGLAALAHGIRARRRIPRLHS